MTTDLALTLSFEGIGLLTRVPGGWHLLGEVTLDSADLAGELADLRAQAIAVGGPDFQTTLVLPNDQIKYLTLPAGRMSEKKRQQKAEDALEEATPYRADQLVFDITTQGRIPQVAAVARETLEEAEAFAVEHAFQPVNFTAIPPQDSFAKAPDFGVTSYASATGLKSNADSVAIQVIGEGPLPTPDPEPVAGTPDAPAPPSEPSAEPASEDTPRKVIDTAPADKASAPVASTPQPDVDQPAADDTPNVTAPSAEAEEKPEPKKAPQAPKDAPIAPAMDSKEPAEPPAAFASIRAQKASEQPAPASGLGGVTRTVSGTNAPSIPSGQNDASAPKLRFDPAKAVAGLKAESGAPSEKDAAPVEEDGTPATFASARGKTMVAGPAPTAAKKDPKPRSKKAQAKAANAKERQNLTIYGSRQSDVRGKPRHLGLILTALLLVFLAGVALWASLFLEDGVAGLFGDDAPAEVAVLPSADSDNAQPPATVRPDTTEDAAADPAPAATASLESATETQPEPPVAEAPLVVTVPDGMTPTPTDSVETALLEPLAADSITDSAEIEAMMDEVSDGSVDPVEAEARYAVTGIWQRSPEQPLDLPSDSSDDIYIASVDRDTISFDAVALPDPAALETDLPAPVISNPVAADTDFDLDERGLVIATAEGALNPDGIMVYAGRPPVVPAAYPKRIKVGEEPQISAEDTGRLATLRPKLRPSDLLEQNERARLGGRTRDELAALRPKLRPESAKQAEERDQTPTQYAVKTSPRPRLKPANIAQIAARAAPDTSTTTAAVAVPAAASVVPDIPTTASVARQATIKNAINLNKVNLIGVYGTSANRRALVRLSSGRYKKVQVGDRVDGGRVSAISEDELHYTKSGRNVVLKMPKG